MSLEILKTSTTRQAREVIYGNTVNYNYQFEEGQPPAVVVFSVVRGIESDEEYTGNPVASGTYTDNNFDVKHKSYEAGDAALIEAINTTCNQLVNPE